MDRFEQARKIAKEYEDRIIANNPSAEAYDFMNAVIYGVQWADKHPNEGLVDMEFVVTYWQSILTLLGLDKHNVTMALGRFCQVAKRYKE